MLNPRCLPVAGRQHDRKSEPLPRPPHYAEPGAARTLSGAKSSGQLPDWPAPPVARSPMSVRVLRYLGGAFATRGRDERPATARDIGGHARPFEPASGLP
jgi:hypothetical protein